MASDTVLEKPSRPSFDALDQRDTGTVSDLHDCSFGKKKVWVAELGLEASI